MIKTIRWVGLMSLYTPCYKSRNSSRIGTDKLGWFYILVYLEFPVIELAPVLEDELIRWVGFISLYTWNSLLYSS